MAVMHGWELDPLVVFAGRAYMGLQQLEDSGKLVGQDRASRVSLGQLGSDGAAGSDRVS